MRSLVLKYFFSFKTLIIFSISILFAYFSYSYGIYLSYRYYLTIEVISVDNILARNKKLLEIVSKDKNAEAVKLVEKYIDSNEDMLGYAINNYNNYNYLYSLATGFRLITLLDRETMEKVDRISSVQE